MFTDKSRGDSAGISQRVPHAESPGARQGEWLPVLALVLNALIWGLSWWPLRALESQGVHPLWATGGSFFAVLTVMTLFTPSLWWRLWTNRQLWLLALSSGFTNLAFNWAVTIGDVVRVILLFYLMPAWAMLLARWLLKEPIHLAGIARLALAIIGVIFVLKTPESSWPIPSRLPDWLALAGGFTFALTNVLILGLNQTSAADRLFAMFAGGTTIALLGAALGSFSGIAYFASGIPTPSFSWWLILAVVALGAFFWLGNLAMQYGASRLKSSTTALVMLTEIIFASGSALLLGAAVIELRIVYGALLILSAAVWAALS